MAKHTAKKQATTSGQMRSHKTTPKKQPIQSYDHKDKKRVYNPPVGMVTPDTRAVRGIRNPYLASLPESK